MAAKQRAKAESGKDAITLLTEDHNKVKKLFKEFEKLHEDGGSSKEVFGVVRQICMELAVHTQVEEEIFYPALRKALDEDDLMDEADVEHDGAKSLIAQLETMKPGDDHYDAKVTVLGEYIEHHVKEEHSDMFPKARKAKLDMAELGEQMMRRKEELQAHPKLLSARG